MIITEIRVAMAAHHEAREHATGFRQSRIDRQYQDGIGRLQSEAEDAFAKLNGWKLSRSRRPADMHRLIPHELRYRDSFLGSRPWAAYLGRVSDHDFACREPQRPYRIVACICQPYHDHVAEAQALAVELGLAVHVPADPFASIWNPGRCQFIVFTRRGHVIRWLPDQACKAV